MNFTKSNIRFSWSLSLGEPLHSRWSTVSPKGSEDTLQCSPETLCSLILHFPTTDISLWITSYTCRSYNHSPLILLLQDTPKFSLLFREYPVPTTLQFFATWIALWIISRTYRVSTHPSWFMYFTKNFEIPFGVPKILSSLLLLKFLLACIMINAINLVILLSSFVIIILSPLIQCVANARNH